LAETPIAAAAAKTGKIIDLTLTRLAQKWTADYVVNAAWLKL